MAKINRGLQLMPAQELKVVEAKRLQLGLEMNDDSNRGQFDGWRLAKVKEDFGFRIQLVDDEVAIRKIVRSEKHKQTQEERIKD